MKFLAIILSLIVATPALSDPEYDVCMNHSDETNASWNVCGNESFNRTERKLGKAFGGIDGI